MKVRRVKGRPKASVTMVKKARPEIGSPGGLSDRR
jgi:hypothetical protein